MFVSSDVITLQCPLTPATRQLINASAVARMKRGVMLINTSRGAVVDTRALIGGLKCGAIGSVGLDVYEEEADLFFQDLSGSGIPDDVFARLLTFPNVLITGHLHVATRGRAPTGRPSSGLAIDGSELLKEVGRVRPMTTPTRLRPVGEPDP